MVETRRRQGKMQGKMQEERARETSDQVRMSFSFILHSHSGVGVPLGCGACQNHAALAATVVATVGSSWSCHAASPSLEATSSNGFIRGRGARLCQCTETRVSCMLLCVSLAATPTPLLRGPLHRSNLLLRSNTAAVCAATAPLLCLPFC